MSAIGASLLKTGWADPISASHTSYAQANLYLLTCMTRNQVFSFVFFFPNAAFSHSEFRKHFKITNKRGKQTDHGIKNLTFVLLYESCNRNIGPVINLVCSQTTFATHRR